MGVVGRPPMSALRAGHQQRRRVLFDNRDGVSTGRADEAGDLVARRLLLALRRLGPHQEAVRDDDGPSMRAPTARPLQQNRSALLRVFNADNARCPALWTALGDLEDDSLGYQ